MPFRVAADGQKLRESLEAFAITSDQTRLMRLRRSVGFAARGHVVQVQTIKVECLMVTLTYAGDNDDWSPRHVSEFLKRVRQWLARRGQACRYVWVAELQKRGVIHYHVALFVHAGTRLPKPDECGWWPHGMTRIEVARAAVPYLLKYLSKDTSKTLGRFPRGARIFGVGGADRAARRARRWLGLPAFVQANSSIDDDWRRAPRGGGWLSPSGEHFPSEFTRVRVGDAWCLKRLHRHDRSIDAAGPFSWWRPASSAVALPQ